MGCCVGLGGSSFQMVDPGRNTKITLAVLPAFLLLFLTSIAFAQPGAPGGAAIGSNFMDVQMYSLTGANPSAVEAASGSVSKLDLKAPAKARREYDKAYELLAKKDFQGAVLHLTTATSTYPDFVAAHNALGSAYMHLGQNEQARGEFAQAVALDDHLPGCHFNLGRAELALKHYPAAVDSIQKASSIAPLDLQLLTALAYAQYMNHAYKATIATAQQVHNRKKHEKAAMVHFYAAGAWLALEDIPQAQQELQTLLQEDPKSSEKEQAERIMDQIKTGKIHAAGPSQVAFVKDPNAPTGPAQVPERVRQTLRAAKENEQIVEVEADAELQAQSKRPALGATEFPTQAEADIPATPARPGSKLDPEDISTQSTGFTFRASVDEVSVFFAATDHGGSVMDLTGSDVRIQDNLMPPAVVTGFRNESQLPMKMGLVIDTSSSVKESFKFEQSAAANFLQRVMTGSNDQAFVIGFANSVLMVQDFTNDQTRISHAIDQLVPSGGTALWDAVAFAADKLASQKESHPVVKILVVISDGEDNSSSVTFKEAIKQVQDGEVIVYTVSTRETSDTELEALVGEHALRTLAQLSGGAAFTPDSARSLNGSLTDLQQVIRSRYLVSYKPTLFKRDGQYHAIDIAAEKNGRKLRIFARKGYFAAPNPGVEHF
jgi:Ca-activated chloride channel family protein